MNIIANNCIGGFIYKYSEQAYCNPFIWTAIYGNSLETLLLNYDSINFSNVYLHDVSGWKDYNLVVDNKLDVKFWGHYKYDPNALTPTKRGDSIYSKDIENFILSSYIKRLARMTEEPTFILHWWIGMSSGTPDYWRTPIPSDDKQYLQYIIETPKKYKTLIFHPYKDIGNGNQANTKFLYDEMCLFPKRSPAFVAKSRLKEILQFVNETDI